MNFPDADMSEHPAKLAVIGCGLVGRSWAIAFARAGFNVAIYDRDQSISRSAIDLLADTLHHLWELELTANQSVDQILARIMVGSCLLETVEGAEYVQENTPEAISVKRAVIEELDRLCKHDCIIASSTSALLPSEISMNTVHPERCLVAHPLNPPHLIPAVEVVPSPKTSKAAVDRAVDILHRAGQRPIRIAREIEGFLMNRLQSALLDEAFAIVSEGVATADDVDIAVKDGLARRWSFMGPFETIDLNAPDGIRDFIERYGPAYESIGRSRPRHQSWSRIAAEQVIRARRVSLPSDAIAERQAWRDRQLAHLSAHFARNSNEQDDQ